MFKNGLRKKPVVIHLWTLFFGNPFPWKETDDDCPQKFIVTRDRNRTDVDIYVVHSIDYNENDLPSEDNGIPWLLYSHETPLSYNRNIMAQFHGFASYRLDSDIPIPLFFKPLLNKPLPFEEKLNAVFGMFSNCEPVRTRYMELLMDSNTIPVHSYGRCLRNRVPKQERYQGKDYREYKTRVSRKYKFALAFQNCDCDYFVDEQLQTIWDGGAVPVFMGTDKIKDFLPENMKSSIIYAKDFPNPADLGKFLLKLANNKEKYNKYLEWKGKGFGHINEKIQKIWSYSVWCRHAMAFASGKINTSKRVEIDVQCQPRKWADWIKV